MFRIKYLDEHGLKGIKDYKYGGGDDSLIYKYVTSPLASWLVKKVVPTWVAPNLITTAGLLLILTTHLQYWYYSPGENFKAEAPAWVHYLAAVNIVLYSLLDNMDGKQARKTGSSSTYGMLLDHGVDCLVSIMIGMNANAAMRADSTIAFYSVLLVGVVPLYTAVWETYQLKGMYLPIFNGPNEGLATICLAFIWTGYVGAHWWEVETLWGLTRAQILIYYSIIIGILTAVLNTYKVLIHKSEDPMKNRILRIVPEAIIIVCLIAVERLSPSGISRTHLRSLLYFFLFGHAKLDILLQMYMAANQEAKLFRISVLAPVVLFTANSVTGHYLGKCPIDEATLLKIGLVYAVATFVHFVISVSYQITEYLGIRIFVIPRNKEA